MQIDQDLKVPNTAAELSRLGSAANLLGREIVDVSGFLDDLTQQSQEQLIALEALRFGSNSIVEANSEVMANIEEVARTAEETLSSVQISIGFISETSEHSVELAGWVRAIHEKSSAIEEILSQVRKSNDQIASIAAQVNVLAMNAKIEAARAGVAGKGFAIVAEAINDLSQKTTSAAEEISSSIQNMANWMSQLQQGAEVSAQRATTLLERSQESDKALMSIETQVSETQIATKSICDQVQRADQAIERFVPSIAQIDGSIRDVTTGVQSTSDRIEKLIDSSEIIVQAGFNLGGASDDEKRVVLMAQDLAGRVEAEFENALALGRIMFEDLFDVNYVPVADTNPQQVLTRFTKFTDRILPAIQEPALELDGRIVFCAAVDRNGYLPTHNVKFSKRQTGNLAWDSANCRSRRIFDDRVGLKAGRSEAPFLVQVYRRDMGEGNYVLMRDISS
ncbi:MAG: methyl-accepting chemotaxis protein, partial [Paracoccaceae bacterium]